MKPLAVVLVAALAGGIGACGGSDALSVATQTTQDSAAGAGAGVDDDPYCEAMGQLIVLLEPSDGPTSPAETEATFTAAAGWFDELKRNAPDLISGDVANYSAAYDEYAHFLSESGFNLDVVFSTPVGQQLAIDISHSLTPSIVEYAIDECGLSFGDEPNPPPTG